MNTNNQNSEPNEREIEMMLKYVPAYTEVNAKNIKDKFIQKAVAKRKKFPFTKVALVAILSASLCVTVLAYTEIVDLGKIYRSIFGEKTEYVEQFIEPLTVTSDTVPKATAPQSPVPIQSEYDGIVIKLISTINDENSLRIFATVTDTKADRLGESLDFTSWGLSQGYGGGVSVVDYDNATKTATVMLTSLGSDHDGSATLTVNDLTIGRELLECLPEDKINVAGLVSGHAPEIVSTEGLWINGGGGGNPGDWGPEKWREIRLLKADELAVPFANTDTFSISNIGFVDGQLHIQAKTYLSGIALTDGYFIDVHLVDPETEAVYRMSKRVDFTDRAYAYEATAKEPHDAYSEMIFDNITSPEQLNGLFVAIDYMKSPTITEGSWEFSFVVPKKVTTEFSVGREIDLNGEPVMVDKVSLSPLGVTLHLPTNMSEDYKHTDVAYAMYEDGTLATLDKVAIHTYEGESTLVFGGQIIEVERVQMVVINSEKISISH